MTTMELLNTMIERADADGLPDLGEVLATAIRPEDLPKLPVTVGEAAELLALSAHTLRYYERIGLVEVDRSESGQRRYDKKALGRIVFITRLRLSGMSIQDISEYIALVRAGEGTVDQRLRLLYAHREKVVRQLQELNFALSVIDYKITTYGGNCSD